MWNWKSIFEDGEISVYRDIDNIVDTEANEDDVYGSVECYQPMPAKVATWVSIAVKDKGTVARYMEQRKGLGFDLAGYEKYRYTLCLAEVDSEKRMYRVLPAIDYDRDDKQLGTSSILSGEGVPLVEGIKTDWSSVRSRGTHKAIRILYRALFPKPKNDSPHSFV
jgi:hypothetical protein